MKMGFHLTMTDYPCKTTCVYLARNKFASIGLLPYLVILNVTLQKYFVSLT
jgi:hypothetical protein